MRLNPDCIRDLLLALEDKVELNLRLDFHKNNCNKLTDKYPPNVILYHLNQCIESGLLKGKNSAGYILIYDITPAGHAFLADIRNDNNWNKTKEIATKVGAFSLNALKDIAVGVVSAGITASLK